MGSQGATFVELPGWLSNPEVTGRDQLTGCTPTIFRLENYYLPMTSYIENKSAPVAGNDLPGPLCFSERIAIHPLSGTSTNIYSDLSVETIKETRKVISNM